jgi:chromosome segregation ATPase
MPLSMDEIVAERDQLRAQFASDRRRIEQAHEALQHTRAKDMVELGRRAASIGALESEIANLRTQLGVAISQTANVQAQAEQAQVQFDVLNQAGQLEISALETGVESLRLANSDLEDELAKARSRLEQASAALEDIERERAFVLTDLAAASARRDALQGAVEAAHAKADEQDGELRELRRDKTRLAREAADAMHALELARMSEAEAAAQAQKQALHAREDARLQSDKWQAMRVERDALAGALEAARREAESLRRGSGSAALDDKSAEGDDLLRKAIVELGAKMLRVANSRKVPARGSPVAPKSGPASLSSAPNRGRSAAAGE